jgi:hypothetical protein
MDQPAQRLMLAGITVFDRISVGMSIAGGALPRQRK